MPKIKNLFSSLGMTYGDADRLATTWKHFSAKTMAQETRMAFQRREFLYFKCLRQAKVMKMLETINKPMVFMEPSFIILPGQW